MGAKILYPQGVAESGHSPAVKQAHLTEMTPITPRHEILLFAAIARVANDFPVVAHNPWVSPTEKE